MGVIITIFVIFLIIGIAQLCKQSSDNKIEQERVQNLTEQERKAYYDDKTIDYTIIVSQDSKKSLGSAVVRGAAGGALLGPAGLVGGALSGKNQTKTTFTVVYKSGRKDVITVDNDSDEFKMYAKYIK